MSIERVKAYFGEYGMEERVREFPVSSATVELAAEALGCEPCRIAKTLSFMTEKGAILVVAAGDAKIDNKKYKGQFNTKAKMLSPQEALELVGHAIGGVCPFGVKEGVSVYLDVSLRRFDTVFTSTFWAIRRVADVCRSPCNVISGSLSPCVSLYLRITFWNTLLGVDMSICLPSSWMNR